MFDKDHFKPTEINLICMRPHDPLREDFLPVMRVSIESNPGAKSSAVNNGYSAILAPCREQSESSILSLFSLL